MSKQSGTWIKAGSYSLLGYAAQLGLAFVSFLFLVRCLSEYDFGVWVLYLTLITTAELARIGLLQNAVVKFCVENTEERGHILTTALIINTLGSIALGGLLLLLMPTLAQLWSAPELNTLVWWYLPWALVHGTARFLDFPHMVEHDFEGIFWSKTAYGIVFLLAIIGLFIYQNNSIFLYQLPLLQVLAAVPSLVVLLLFRSHYLQWGSYRKAWANKILHFGKFVLGTNISSMLFNKMDLMMVGAFLNPAAVAVYNVATRVTNYMEVPMSGIAQVIYPKMTAVNKGGSKLAIADLYEKSLGLILAIVIPMVLVVFLCSKWVVVLIAGQNYATAAPLLNILLLAVMIKPWARLFGITLDAIGKPKLNFSLLFASLLINILLNALLIQQWGLHGAAFATLGSIVFLVVSGQLIIKHYLPIQQKNVFQSIIKTYISAPQYLKLKKI